MKIPTILIGSKGCGPVATPAIRGASSFPSAGCALWLRVACPSLAAIGSLALSIAACTPAPPPPVRIQADSAAVCEALRADLPVKYHGNSTDAETVANIRRANARFRAACP